MLSTVLIAFVLAASGGSGEPQSGSSASVRTVEIVGTDDLKFSVTRIAAKPGERLRIVLKSEGRMPKRVMAHNVVVLQPDVDVEAFNADALAARDTDYLPPGRKNEIVAATGLAGAGETVEVTFTVPGAAGDYPYVCSFPGHTASGMRGVLEVKR